MNLSEYLEAYQTDREEAATRQADLMKKSLEEKRCLNESESKEYDDLGVTVKALDKQIERVQEQITKADATEAEDGETAKPVDTEKSASAPIILSRKYKDEEFEGQGVARLAIAKALAAEMHIPPSVIAQERWGKVDKTFVDWVKANEIAAASTVSNTWANYWTGPAYQGDFIEYLNAQSVYGQISAMFTRVPPNVPIKGQDGAATAYFVGDGAAIPASAASASTVTLGLTKVGALAMITKDLLRVQSVDAERIVRDALVEATVQKIDTAFLGNSAASGATPAGIRNSISEVSGFNDTDNSTGNGIRAIVKALEGAFITAKNVAGARVWVMNPADKLGLSLLVNELGQAEFGTVAANNTLFGHTIYSGDNIAAGTVMLLKPSDVYVLGDSGVEVSVSTDATIEMASDPTGAAAVSGSVPAAQSKQPVSMFQSESVAIKVVRPINWARRRTSALAWTGDFLVNNDET